MTTVASTHPEIWSWVILPILIFLARIVDVSIGTVRILFLAKGYRILTPLIGFFEVLIWLMAITQIMQNLSNPITYLAFAAGFATGNYVGILLEKKLAMGIVLIRVITRQDAIGLITHLREQNYIVTGIEAEGNEGPVKVLFTIINRKDVESVIETIKGYNPRAFYTIEDVNYVSQPVSRLHGSKVWKMDLLGVKRK